MAADSHSHVPALLETIGAEVSSHLERLLEPPSADVAPIYEAMRYSIAAGGKRFRPALVLLTARMLGADDAAAMPAACAIEMIHTYSLIHDDLPAMDNDDLRRGRPTSHKVFGEAMAILAGDALLTEAFVVLSRPNARLSADQQIRVVHELASAAGACGMASGQVADLQAERDPSCPFGVETIHRLKTGRMIEAAVTMGAVLGGAGAEDLGRLRDYGRSVGLAFQIADDILDTQATTDQMGKTAGKDAAQGKRTYVSQFGLAEAKRRAADELALALAALRPFGDRSHSLADLARFCVERRA
ncbi:MAG TPA: polyprenyl synthetase family protein [Phycisphaerae bacterium]|nr:polyprenyl synthetase family protein [Phycisphaerae bacterium]HOI55441.1 polyprenyl synthetase family protein [Phycisphaerae bacterium]